MIEKEYPPETPREKELSARVDALKKENAILKLMLGNEKESKREVEQELARAVRRRIVTPPPFRGATT